jgi:hypothetical protein
MSRKDIAGLPGINFLIRVLFRNRPDPLVNLPQQFRVINPVDLVYNILPGVHELNIYLRIKL